MTIYEQARELAMIRSAAEVISWDQETYMPRDAAKYRATQLAWLSSRAHELATSNNWRTALDTAEAEDAGDNFKHTANLRELRREFNRASKLPVDLIARDSAASSLAKHAWADARERSDFESFAPHLQGLLDIAREKADLWGYEGEPYDALLEAFERGTCTAVVADLLDHMRPVMREVAAHAVAKSQEAQPSLPAGPYPMAAQMAFNQRVAESIGFDFEAGRIDTTTHPFCTTLGPRDVRLTTRYDEADFTSSLFGVLHEAGHGLYEQGLDSEDFGLPSGTAVSLGIHESQSRLWENHVGRSTSFWEYWYPEAQAAFPQLAGYSIDKFMAYLRRANFSPIRVEADEATYDLHILLRFELERKLMNGQLRVKDVPNAWNEISQELFGFAPNSNREGCLQDIHWSMGGLGYFATYTLGNINSAQLFAAAKQDADVASGIQSASYLPLLDWLRDSVHMHGGIYDPRELMKLATGKYPSTDAYLTHLKSRYL